MESKANYTLVGAFVLLFGISLVGFVLWLGKYGDKEDSSDYYKVYIRDSVAGLDQESPVKFRGVHVGSVRHIMINPENSEEIEVLLKIQQGTPIKEDSYVELGSQGLTGLSYIELKGGSKESPLLRTSAENIGIITARESFFSSLKSSATDISGKLNETLSRINLILADENLKHLHSTLKNVDTFTLAMNERIKSFDTLVSETVALEQKGVATLTQIDQLVIELKSTAKSMDQAAKQTDRLIAEVNQGFAQGDYNLRAITQESVERLNDVLGDTKMLIQSARDAVENLKESPSDLLFKTKETQRGPGES